MNLIDKKQIYSIVIRCADEPEMIIKYIEQMPDNTCAVFMLHSILPEDNKYYGTDPWNWSLARFEKFCGDIKALKNTGSLGVVTLNQVVSGTF